MRNWLRNTPSSTVRPLVRTGTVTGREVRANRDGDKPRLMLQVQITGPDDIQTIEYVPQPGQDENPINDTKVFIIQVSESYKIAIGADDGVEPAAATGEKWLHSVNDGGDVQALLKLLKSGIIEINGSADNAVRFQALQDKLTALETQLISHVHPGVTAGGASTSPSATVFDIDISAAKVDEVKLP